MGVPEEEEVVDGVPDLLGEDPTDKEAVAVGVPLTDPVVGVPPLRGAVRVVEEVLEGEVPLLKLPVGLAVGLPVIVALLVDKGLAPSVKLPVGLGVGEADIVAVDEVLGDIPSDSEGVGVVVGLALKESVEVVEGLAPIVKLLVGV